MSTNGLHEDNSCQSDDAVSSERNLGLTFTAVFATLAAWSFHRGGGYATDMPWGRFASAITLRLGRTSKVFVSCR